VRHKLEEHSYFVAICAVALALGLEFLLSQILGSFSPFLLFLGAIAFCSWLGGFRSGLLATALSSVVIDLFFMEPVGTFFFGKSTPALVSLGVFAGVSSLVCALFYVVCTERQALETAFENAEAARDRAEQANQLKGNFIANMSHEIRAPLSAVLGYSDALATEELSVEEKKSYSERLKKNAAQLTHLVTDLLDVAELSPSSFVVNRKRMSLPEFMEKAYSTFAPMAEEKGLRFQIHLRGSIPTYIESDGEQIMQLLRQVVGNAIRYSDSGLVKLTAMASTTPTQRREVAFIVNDQGPGISADIRKKLFKPFDRETIELAATHESPAAPHLASHSTGLGLTVARKLARGLGGDVKLAKSDRKGTSFLITIDAGQVNEVTEFFERLSLPAHSEISPDDPNALDGVKILVVDDSSDSAVLVSRMLRIVGAEVATASRGQEGIDKALEMKPDVVLMDIEMPEMDGFEATRRLRARKFENPIIALSAHVMREDRQEAHRSGASAYLMKPISRRALLETLALHVRSQDGYRAPGEFLETTHYAPQPSM
jgi:signal transduction histidine kinase/ActR/RegA family two-component response regulator